MARLPHTNIAVDYWRLDPGISLRFLTHCHADHTKGLSQRWNYGTIYCSTISARILKNRFSIDPAIIRELEINSTTLIFLDEAKTESMSVTVLDANHCPGSVMFLFRGYFGTILHTGDFRWSAGAIDLSPLEGLTVDILYLDNTYLDSRQAQFPSREEAYALMRDVVAQHLDHIIYVGVDSIGKEELLTQLAHDLGIKVAVTEERYRELQLMGLAESCFTTDDTDALIRVMPKERITLNFLREANVSKPAIGILPTGWREKWSSKLRAGKIFHVPYSLHSSYAELFEFVAAVRPRAVRPIVLDHGDVSVLSDLLDPSLPAPVTMPAVLRTPSLARLAPITPIQRVPPPAARRRTQSAGTLVVVKAEIDMEEEEKLAKQRLIRRAALMDVPIRTPDATLDPLDALADALDSERDVVPVKTELGDEPAPLTADAPTPEPLLRAHSDPSPEAAPTKLFRKQNLAAPLPRPHTVSVRGPSERDSVPPPSHIIRQPTALNRAANFTAPPPPLLTPPSSPPPSETPTSTQQRHVPVSVFERDDDALPAAAVLLPIASALSRAPSSASRKRPFGHPLARDAHAARAVLARREQRRTEEL